MAGKYSRSLVLPLNIRPATRTAGQYAGDVSGAPNIEESLKHEVCPSMRPISSQKHFNYGNNFPFPPLTTNRQQTHPPGRPTRNCAHVVIRVFCLFVRINASQGEECNCDRGIFEFKSKKKPSREFRGQKEKWRHEMGFLNYTIPLASGGIGSSSSPHGRQRATEKQIIS